MAAKSSRERLPVAENAPRRKLIYVAIVSALATAGALVAAPAADARTTKLEITSRTIAFGGYSFAGVGQFERIVGIAYGEVDPSDPKNAVIVDIGLAPTNATGKVEYAHNFYILKPLDLSKGNHKMMYEPPNRGGKTHGTLNRGAGGNDPGAVTDPAVLANTFLWPRGYTTVWSGWEDLASLTSLTATVTLPIAKDPGNVTITGPAYEYIVTSGASFSLSYPAASLSQDPASARLTHRVHLDDPPVDVPASGWAYTDATGTAIKLTTGNFVGNDIYDVETPPRPLETARFETYTAEYVGLGSL